MGKPKVDSHNSRLCRVARPWKVIFGFGISIFLSSTGWALKCPDPPAQYARDVQVDTKAKVAKLGKLGVGELENQTAVVVRPLLDKVANADRLILAQMMTSVFCQMLSESTLPEREKFDRFGVFQKELMELVLDQKSRDTGKTKPPAGSGVKQEPGSSRTTARITRRPGDEFRDNLRSGGTAPWMVALPGGTYAMGSHSSEEYRNADEGPVRYVTIAPVALSKYEITFEQYDAYSRSTKQRVLDDVGTGRGNNPVIGVTWPEAHGYAEWLTKQTGARYRLPSEAEWEYAARGGSTQSYMWPRNQMTACSLVNLFDRRGKEVERKKAEGREGRGSLIRSIGLRDPVSNDCDDYYATIAPVDRFPANGYGLHSMIGNVWEWTQDCYNPSYDESDTSGKAVESGRCSSRVLRGSSYASQLEIARFAARLPIDIDKRIVDVGFRVAREID